MPKMNLSVPHTLGSEVAIERLKGFITKIKQRHEGQVKDLEENWEANCLRFGFTTFGFKIRGSMFVEAEQVRIEGELPFAAMMFKGKIEQEIRDTLTKLLAA